jgi:hypothetical protein
MKEMEVNDYAPESYGRKDGFSERGRLSMNLATPLKVATIVLGPCRGKNIYGDNLAA